MDKRIITLTTFRDKAIVLYISNSVPNAIFTAEQKGEKPEIVYF